MRSEEILPLLSGTCGEVIGSLNIVSPQTESSAAIIKFNGRDGVVLKDCKEDKFNSLFIVFREKSDVEGVQFCKKVKMSVIDSHGDIDV